MQVSDLIDVTVRHVPEVPGAYRVVVICSDCASWDHGFPASPSPDVPLSKVMAVGAEHFARFHPGQYKIPDIPILTAEVPPREPVVAPLPRADAIGPIGE